MGLIRGSTADRELCSTVRKLSRCFARESFGCFSTAEDSQGVRRTSGGALTLETAKRALQRFPKFSKIVRSDFEWILEPASAAYPTAELTLHRGKLSAFLVKNLENCKRCFREC